MCLGSHRVGINNQGSDSGIPSDLRTCVNGEGLFSISLACEMLLSRLPVCVCVCVVWQRSVTSAHRFRATRRVQSAVWMARPSSHACANLAGRACAVKMVSSDKSFGILNVFFFFKLLISAVVWCDDSADINECSDPEFPAGCNQKCHNFPGSFQCLCEDGYFISNKINCVGKTSFVFVAVCAA